MTATSSWRKRTFFGFALLLLTPQQQQQQWSDKSAWLLLQTLVGGGAGGRRRGGAREKWGMSIAVAASSSDVVATTTTTTCRLEESSLQQQVNDAQMSVVVVSEDHQACPPLNAPTRTVAAAASDLRHENDDNDDDEEKNNDKTKEKKSKEDSTFSKSSQSSASLSGAPLGVEADADAAAEITSKSTSTSMAKSSSTTTSRHGRGAAKAAVGRLRPADLPEPVAFDNFTEAIETWKSTTSTSSCSDVTTTTTRTVAHGTVTQINSLENSESTSQQHKQKQKYNHHQVDVNFTMIRQAVPHETVIQMLSLLRNYSTWDMDPDTVDGMPTYEIFLDNPDLQLQQQQQDQESSRQSAASATTGMKILDSDPVALPGRRALREQMQRLTQPILDQVLTPYIRQHYYKTQQEQQQQHDDAGDDDENNNSNKRECCTPCYSLIRRYVPGERQSHAPHHDGHALVTAVVSLTDYGRDYQGGLYVSTGYGQRLYVPLRAGDAVIHSSMLLHGVQVYPVAPDKSSNSNNNKTRTKKTERWSWILWYRDSCDTDYSYEWFRECALQHENPVCQHLHSTKVGNTPGITSLQAMQQMVLLNQRAARAGMGTAAVKMARAYLHQLSSPLPYNETAAALYYQKAIQSHHPDGHYGMAQLLLQQLQQQQQQQLAKEVHDNKKGHHILTRVVHHLEEAALLHHSYSMFNLGMVHTYGYGVQRVNMTLAVEWFVASGLPEGYFVASQHALAVQNEQRYQYYTQRAAALGYFTPWRVAARTQTGSGGAGGVDLNMPWPEPKDKNRGRPPKF